MKYSIIIPTYNGVNLLAECLPRVFQHTQDCEVIVVSNGCTDGTLGYLSALQKENPLYHENLKVVVNEVNKGFAGAVNAGLGVSTGDYIILLNNDVLVTPAWASQMSNAMRRYEKRSGLRTGLVGPATNYAGGRQSVPNVHYEIDSLDSFASQFHRHHVDQLDQAGFLSGFCLMFKRAVYDAVGDFEEKFFPGGYEDNDFLLRANEQNWCGIIDGTTFVHHYGGRTFHKKEFANTDNGLSCRNQFLDKWADPDRPRKLVAIYRVKGPDDYFEESLTRTSVFADEICVLIDNPDTNDQSEAIARKFSKVVDIHISRKDFDERGDRNKLLAMAYERNPDWIISIDDDEVFEDKFDRAYVERLMHPVNPHVKMYGFHWRTFFNGTERFRTDGIFGKMTGYRMFKVESERWIHLGTEKGLHCFLPDTHVTCVDNGGLIHQVPIQSVKVGDKVLTSSGEFYPVGVVHKRSFKGDVRTLKMWGGQKFTCTSNHEIYTLNGKISARELKVKDQVKTPFIKKVSHSQRTNSELLFLGYFLGDGHSQRGVVNIFCNMKHKDRIQEVYDTAVQCGFNVKLREDPSRHVVRVECFKNKDFRKELQACTRPKRMPQWLFSCTDIEIGKTLRGLFLSDGFMLQNKWPIFTNCDRSLAYSVYLLLRTVGISAVVTEDTSTGFDDGKHTFYKVCIYDGDSRKRFVSLTDIDIDLPKNSRTNHGTLASLQIKSIDDTYYDGFIYNLSVETNHSYVVEGVVVSNCGNIPLHPMECGRWTGIRVKHYGYCSPEKCHRKHKFYEDIDDEKISGLIGGENYDHLIQQKMVTYPWIEDSSLSLVMTVHNGGHRLWELLDAMAPMADEIIFADNECDDDSLRTVKRFGAKIIPVKFEDDFSKLKNKSIEEATSNWILLMDWDENIEYSHIPNIRKMMDHDTDGYMFPVYNHQRGGEVSLSEAIRLFRNIPEMRYTGLVHENFDDAMAQGLVSVLRSEVPLHHYGFLADPRKMDRKLALYQRLNEKQLQENPQDVRAAFNLALHYLNENNYIKGTGLLQYAISINDHFYQAHKELGLAHIRQGQKSIQRARDILDKDHPLYQSLNALDQAIISVIGEKDIVIGSRGK